MTHVRIITPIITKGFRDLEAINALAPAGVVLSQVTLEHGPASVESAVDEVLAGPGVVDAACRAEADKVDAVVIDCMLDPALEAAREAVSIPVIGCGEAAFTKAAGFGRFSVVTVLQRQEHAFKRLAGELSLSANLASVVGIGMSVLALEKSREEAISATMKAGRLARNRDEACSIVFGCTGMLGYGPDTADALGWSESRVIDPLKNAVTAAIQAVRGGQKPDKERFPYPDRKLVSGFDAWTDLDEIMRPISGASVQ